MTALPIRRGRSGQAGFTLLEILAALAVTATVLLATIGLLRSLTFTFDRGVRRVDTAEQLVLAVERLSQDIASTRYSQREAGGALVALLTGMRDRLSFLARAGVGLRAGEEEAIALTVETTQGSTKLVRRRAAWPGGGHARLEDQAFGNPVVLIEGDVEIALAYGRIDSKGGLVWADSWVNQPTLPRYVRLTVRERATGADLLPGAVFTLRADAPPGCAKAETGADCLQGTTKPDEKAKPEDKAKPAGSQPQAGRTRT